MLYALCLCWLLVAWTYVLFPVLLLIWSRLLGRMPDFRDADGYAPRLAVVVAAYNEERHTAAKVANTWSLDYPAANLRLFFGSDGSTDGTNAALQANPDDRLVPFLFPQRRGKVSVLNDVMSSPELRDFAPEVVVLSDANSMYAPDALRKLVRHFADPRVGCVNGELEYEHAGGASGEGLYWKYEIWLKKLESRLNFVIGCYGGILAIRPELYQAPPASTIVEDFVISMRVLEQGYHVRFDAEARAVEPATANSSAEWGRKVRIGAGNYQALALTRRLLSPRFGFMSLAFWSHKVLRWFVPFFLLGALAANLGMVVDEGAGFAQPSTWSLAFQLVGMAIAVWAFRLPPEATPPAWTKPFSYFYLMNYGLLCGFARHIRRTQPVTWQTRKENQAA